MRLKIGDFARLANVSPKTLHHYDIGLFSPESVDRFTGYRYYALDQLPELNRILALRDLGFSLEQIRQLLSHRVTPAELRGMLRLRRAQLEGEIETARGKLAQVDIRLRWIEQEGKMPEIEVLMKQVPGLYIAGAREVVPLPEQMRERCIALDSAACRVIGEMHLETDGVSLAVYHGAGAAGPGEAGIDVEMAYVVQPPARLPAGDTAQGVHELPAAQVAYAVYRGSYDDFGAVGRVHAALCQWIEDRGYRIAGPSREHYLRPPRSGTDRIGVMEIQYPVVPAGAAL